MLCFHVTLLLLLFFNLKFLYILKLFGVRHPQDGGMMLFLAMEQRRGTAVVPSKVFVMFNNVSVIAGIAQSLLFQFLPVLAKSFLVPFTMCVSRSYITVVPFVLKTTFYCLPSPFIFSKHLGTPYNYVIQALLNQKAKIGENMKVILGARDTIQSVECFPSMSEALGSVSSNV